MENISEITPELTPSAAAEPAQPSDVGVGDKVDESKMTEPEMLTSVAVPNIEDDGRNSQISSKPQSSKECSLDENDEVNVSNSWRNDSNAEAFDEDFSDEEDDYSDDFTDVDEEAAEEWLNRYYMKQRGLPEILASLPSTIKISRIPETEEDKLRREEKAKEELGKSFFVL